MGDITRSKTCWIITDGSAGMENQCLGLAEAMGLSPTIKRIHTQKPWRWLPPSLWFSALSRLKPSGDQLLPPWPDILITCGRQAIPMSIAIRKLNLGKTFTVHIQTPNTTASNFDLVIVPHHDKLRGTNILVSEGSLTRITDEKLDTEYAQFSNQLANLPKPVVTVLVGGSNKCYDVTPDVMRDLCVKLQQLHDQEECHFLVTTSRRTGSENVKILQNTLNSLPHTFWQGDGNNPYFAFLKKADAIIVTADSVNMACEAVSAGKPVYIFELKGGNNKFLRFHDRMKNMGFTKPFEGSLSDWETQKLRESQRLADIVWSKIAP